jgi:hypothetical protein
MKPSQQPIVFRSCQLIGAGGNDVVTRNEEYRDGYRDRYREYPVRTSSGARAGIVVAIVAILAIIAAFAFGLIDVKQTRDAQLPDVSVRGGQAPAYDVDTAKVDVGSKTADVTVPKVDVGTKKEPIKVPTVDVQKAK